MNNARFVATLAAGAVLGCAGSLYAQDDCSVALSQNSSDDITDGGVACAGDGITTENSFARSYDLSLGETAGSDFQVSCIAFGIQNTGSEVEANVNIYIDTDGGPPVAPGVDLVLQASVPFTVPAIGGIALDGVNFDPPVCIPADSVMVIELATVASTDGFCAIGTNSAGESGPVYLLSGSCGITEYVTYSDIGFDDLHWVQTVYGNLGCDPSNTCVCEFGPPQSNCFEVHPEPGCDDPICEELVCDFNPLCCKLEWDADCVAAANDLCDGTTLPCELPECSVSEDEPCGEDLNGGCNMDVPEFGSIEIGGCVSGTFWADLDAKGEGSRDTDWYAFTLDEASTVTFEVYSTQLTTALLITGGCPAEIITAGNDANCPNVAEFCLEPGTYVAFVAPAFFEGLPCDTGDQNNYVCTLSATPITEGCPSTGDECTLGGNTALTYNLDLTIDQGGVACAAGGITTENTWCVSYDLSVGETAGSEFQLNCVDFGFTNGGNELNGAIQAYLDQDGGAPVAPGVDLELLGTRELLFVGTPGNVGVTAQFDPPICVPADSQLVIALDLPASETGFASFAGNAAGSDGPTYILSESCGLNEFASLADIGFPDSHWVVEIKGDLGCGGEPTDCPADFNNDGVVNGEDLGVLLGNWGCTGDPAACSCVADLDGNCLVDGADLGSLLGQWGVCE
ncbi:MAG: hypothetical protein CMJ32_09750 [Phycisphaerae bacterium]|nr:hypothetical protein [Phycisphaerae bacterium]